MNRISLEVLGKQLMSITQRHISLARVYLPVGQNSLQIVCLNSTTMCPLVIISDIPTNQIHEPFFYFIGFRVIVSLELFTYITCSNYYK